MKELKTTKKMKTMATREEVYKAIDSEREFQEKLWNNLNKEINNPSSFILWMEEYISKARTLASTTDERNGTEECRKIMDVIRKVTALGVACMEINGAPHRKTQYEAFVEKTEKKSV